MGEKLQHIRHPGELSAVNVWRQMIWRRTSPRVLIEAEGAPAQRIRAWESELSRLQGACGCEQGAAGLFVGLGGYLLYLLLRPGGWGHPGRKEFWIGLAAITFTASVGKALGLLLTQRRLNRVIREIQANWKPQGLPAAISGELPRARPWVGQTGCCGDRPSDIRGAGTTDERRNP